MASPYFKFQRFVVWHDQCAMKVGTDGVLLGTWVKIPEDKWKSLHILDIGTGSGLIALILAQRSEHHHSVLIDAIDIDSAAAAQASYNFRLSPWNARLNSFHSMLQDWQHGPYDLIVSNPPYFVDSLKNPDKAREMARHTDTLSYAELTEHAHRLLKEDGKLAVILPADAENEFLAHAKRQGMQVERITRVYSKPDKETPLRILLMLQKTKKGIVATEDTLYIESEDSPRSEAYQALTKEFYL